MCVHINPSTPHLVIFKAALLKKLVLTEWEENWKTEVKKVALSLLLISTTPVLETFGK